MTRERAVDRRSLDGGGLDDPRRLGARRAWDLSRAELQGDRPVVLAPNQRPAIADQPGRYVAFRDVPRRRVFQASPSESWRAAIAAHVGLVIVAILWIVVLLAMTSTADAAAPGDRCESCRIQPISAPAPRPTPTVVGITPRPVPTTVGLPVPTIPATDTE